MRYCVLHRMRPIFRSLSKDMRSTFSRKQTMRRRHYTDTHRVSTQESLPLPWSLSTASVLIKQPPENQWWNQFWKLKSYKEYIRAQWLFNIQIHLQLGWNLRMKCEILARCSSILERIYLFWAWWLSIYTFTYSSTEFLKSEMWNLLWGAGSVFKRLVRANGWISPEQNERSLWGAAHIQRE